ncbi:hypothetical protein A7U60_g938 [Sanghuangporus baumii]|uniref:Xylanolytic transcriptional activator regulatory domain-containing protein n=1 Tax=Sanghuangporus baumii TaxID=108892 RepID=A0A9Q5I525_SANBA|nr:hypothetical protein A7U60_g938 [Sanghuangporus baumii]
MLATSLGKLTAGQGSRFVLANTDKLHEKLVEMSKRIRQLEDALQVMHAITSPTRHPLLSDDLLAIKSGIGVFSDKTGSLNDAEELANELSSELGTLSISERGEACFMGRGSSEALLAVMSEATTEQDTLMNDFLSPSALSRQILLMSDTFPFSIDCHPKAQILEMIEAQLPPYARATALAEAYLANIAWSLLLVDREQIFEELLPLVYRRSRNTHNVDVDESQYVHHLALLLCVFASGASGDLTLPVGNDEAELYNHLARAALGLKSVFAGLTMESVQAILMMAVYDFNSSRRYSLEPSWKMLYFGLSLALSIGLHRDPARWNMDPSLMYRRRRVFWEIFALDKWKSLESGRPAMFNLREVDCEFPEDREATLDEQGQQTPGYWHWKYGFVKELLAPIAEQLCQTKPSKYSEILDLDRKVREYPTHHTLQNRVGDFDEDVATDLRRYNSSVLREIALLFAHRSFFARALLENPTRPLGSPFVSSLLSAYASAMTVLQIIRVYFEKYPQILLRQWMIWAHGVTSSVIVGCVACRGPVSPVAASALKELVHSVEMFKAAQLHPVPRRALPFLLRLLEKARSANQPPPREAGSAHQELSILGGAPIFLNRASKRGSVSSNSTPPTSPISTGNYVGMQSGNVFHPNSSSVVEQTLQSRQTIPAYPQYSQSDSCRILHEQYRTTLLEENAIPLNPADGMWPTRDTSSSLESQATFGPGTSAGWNQNSRDLSSTSWLEELSSNIPVGFGQDSFNGSNAANLDFLLGGGVQSVAASVPRPEQGDDPIIAEAWHSLLIGS